MIKKKIYYKIAGHIVAVEGSIETMRQLDGFDQFAVDAVDEDTSIRLNENPGDLSAGIEYYTLGTPSVDCHFTRHETGYGLYLTPHDGNGELSLRYTSTDRSCEISGNLMPGLLKFAMWTAFGLAFIRHRTVAVHASAIVYNGKAVLFLGESGTGKSTHARLWCENIRGATVLNDDSPVLRVEDGRCFVYGSPWSGKTPCYRQIKVELAAIIRLSQGADNRIRHLALHEAIGALYPSFPPAFSADENISDSIYDILSEVLKQIPVYQLECRPDIEAAQLAFHTVYSGTSE